MKGEQNMTCKWKKMYEKSQIENGISLSCTMVSAGEKLKFYNNR